MHEWDKSQDEGLNPSWRFRDEIASTDPLPAQAAGGVWKQAHSTSPDWSSCWSKLLIYPRQPCLATCQRIQVATHTYITPIKRVYNGMVRNTVNSVNVSNTRLHVLTGRWRNDCLQVLSGSVHTMYTACILIGLIQFWLMVSYSTQECIRDFFYVHSFYSKQ